MKKVSIVLVAMVVMLGFCVVAVMQTSSDEEELEFFAEIRRKPSQFTSLQKRPPDHGPEMRKIMAGRRYHREDVLAKLWQESAEMYQKWANPECLLITRAEFDYKEGNLYVWFEGRQKHLPECVPGSGDLSEPLTVYSELFDELYDLVNESSVAEKVRRQVRVQIFWFNLTKPDAGLVLYRLIRIPEATPKGSPRFFYAII